MEPDWPNAKFMGFNKEKMLPNEMEDAAVFDGHRPSLIVHTRQPTLPMCLQSTTLALPWFKRGKMCRNTRYFCSLQTVCTLTW